MRRIMINASLCDGCKNCTVACMQAHRDTPGTVYDLDLTDIHNESRNHIEKMPDGSYRPIFCRVCHVLHERRPLQRSGNGNCLLRRKKMRLLLYVCHELSLRRFKSRHRNPYKSRQM